MGSPGTWKLGGWRGAVQRLAVGLRDRTLCWALHPRKEGAGRMQIRDGM